MRKPTRIPASAVFGCDWNDKEAVIRLAIRMGSGMVVYKHPNQTNYNVTHAERYYKYPSEYAECQLIHET